VVTVGLHRDGHAGERRDEQLADELAVRVLPEDEDAHVARLGGEDLRGELLRDPGAGEVARRRRGAGEGEEDCERDGDP
jgi:hypothetical protein